MPTQLLKYAVGRALRGVASTPADLSFRVSNAPPLFTHLEKCYNFTPQRPDGLTSLELSAVAELESKGVFVTDVHSLGFSTQEVDQIMECGRQLAAILASRAYPAGSLRPAVIKSNPADLLRCPVIFRWGLNRLILRIVEAYLGQPVAYDGPLVYHTRAFGRKTSSGRWHLDREDRRVVKVVLYLNDVSDSGGPFELVSHEARRPEEPFRYKFLDTTGLEERLGTDIVSRETVTCTGAAGSLVFAETGRFYHRGKPVTDRARSAIFFSYFARSPRHPFYCARSGLSRSHLIKLTAGLSPEQKATALWRDFLPLGLRLIPPSLT